MASKRPEPRECVSIRDLAAACGVTPRSARSWVAHARFPVHRDAPWSEDEVAEILAWRNTLRPNRSAPDYRAVGGNGQIDKDKWLARKYRAQALREEGSLVPVADVRRLVVRAMTEIRDRLQLMSASVAPLLTDQTAEQRQQTIDDYVADALADVAKRIKQLGDEAPLDSDGDEPGDPASGTAEAE